jgi:hypothetical protein
MRVAIQLYGHLRTFQSCAVSLEKYIFSNENVDVFIHTWSETEHNTRSWYPDSFREEPKILDKKILNDIQQLYKPKGLIIDQQPLFSEEGHFGTHEKVQISLLGLKHSMYSIYQANLLREKYQQQENIKYDLVFITRPDIEFQELIRFLEFDRYFNFYNNTLIHLVHRHELNVRERQLITYPQMIDVAFFGKPDTVSIATGMYTFFDRYLKDYNLVLPKGVEIPELAWRQYLGERGIVSLYFRFSYAIRRTLGKGDITLVPPPILSPKPTFTQTDRENFYKVLIIKALKATIIIINIIAFKKFNKVLERLSIFSARAASYLSQRI